MEPEVDLVPQYDCEEGRCRDMFWEFIYIIVIPWSVLWFVVFVVSIIMCCGSCKRKKKTGILDEAQLLKYNSIRRASVTLRNLSHNRDTPLLSSRGDRSDRDVRDARTASLNLERDHRYRRGMRGTASAPGTLRREQQREARLAMTASTLSAASSTNQERLVN